MVNSGTVFHEVSRTGLDTLMYRREFDMKSRVLLLVPVLVLFLSSHAPAWDGWCFSQRKQPMGDSFRSARDNQVLNPDAARDLTPVYGLDGEAAERVYHRYLQTFEKPSKGSTTILNIGGIMSGGSGQ